MNNPTCSKCDCVKGCQSIPTPCPILLAECIASGQVTAYQIEQHRVLDAAIAQPEQLDYKTVMQQALDALEGVLDDDKDVLKASISGGLYEVVDCQRSIASLRAAIAQPAQGVDK